jgi:hypothetical protein
MKSKQLEGILTNTTPSNKIKCSWAEEKGFSKVDGDMVSQELIILIRLEHLFFTKIKTN